MESNGKNHYEEIISSYREKMDEQHYIAALESIAAAMMILTELSPSHAQEIVEKMESVHFRNHLTAHEAHEICSEIINEDGSKGAHWTCDQVKEMLQSIEIAEERVPDYNFFAIYTMTNLLYSDHATSVEDLVNGESGHVICNMAYRKLTNKNKCKVQWPR